MANGKIAKITDVGAPILLSVVADSFQSVDDAGGVEFGSNTNYSTGLGFNTGSDGGLNFVDYASSAEFLALDGKGQIVWKATPVGVTQFDNNASSGAGTAFVSGSNGYDRTVNGNMLTNRLESDGPAGSSVKVTPGEFTNTKYVAAASPTNMQVHSYPDNAHIEYCFTFDDSLGPNGTWELRADGAPITTGEMGTIVGTETWFQTIFGVNQGGGAEYLGDVESAAFQMDLIVSSDPVVALSDFGTIGVFGDSFADFFTRTGDNQALNLTGHFQLQALFFNKFQQSVTITPDANSGFTMCDTGANDLVDEFPGFVATAPKIGVVFAANNDYLNASDAEIVDATTGTQKRYEELITDLFNNGVTERVIILTGGSPAANTSTDTGPNRSRFNTVRSIQLGLGSFGDALAPGFVQVVDLYTLLGLDAFSVNYIGWLSTLGNNTSPGVALPDNIHPSGQGSYELSTEIFNAIFASETLITTYDNQLFTLNSSVNLDVSGNWVNIDINSFTSPDLPIGLSISSAGTITGNMRIGGIIDCNIHVTGNDGAKLSAGFIWYERL